ncbi:MAG: peptide-methionine (S)-S-oxide reductase MsrA [Anaerolineales bacterium]
MTDKPMTPSTDGAGLATLAGGCFWCLDAVYRQLRGVSDVVSGYTGGRIAKPDYEDVSSGRTGHAEAVQIHFDPAVISYQDLLDIFFTIHDPTTLNRQGADVGTQYRSAIYYHSPDQKQIAEQAMARLAADRVWTAPIVTELKPAETFYTAEPEHQDYFAHNPYSGYCRMVIAPKVSKLRSHFLEKLQR